VTVLLAARHSSCAAIATIESLRIIDPMLYPPILRRKRPEEDEAFCPSLPKFARSGQRQKEGGFDWI
jgi:hypothetical protein